MKKTIVIENQSAKVEDELVEFLALTHYQGAIAHLLGSDFDSEALRYKAMYELFKQSLCVHVAIGGDRKRHITEYTITDAEPDSENEKSDP